MLVSMRKVFATIALVAALAGCNAARIPNNVTVDEYALDADGVKAHSPVTLTG